MELILENLELILAAILAVLGLWKGAAWWKYLSAAVRIARVAYEEAQRVGIINELKGTDKATPFMETFFRLWEQRFGEPPNAVIQGVASYTAASESIKHKLQELADPK